MDDILEQVRDAVEAPIDFEGQRLATLLNYGLQSTFGVLSFFVGYFTQNVYYALYVTLIGLVATMLIIVPPWPIYNRNPVKWLSSATGGMFVTASSGGESKKQT